MAESKYKLVHKRSNQLVDETLPKAPQSGVLQKGEIAVNYNNIDPCLFIEKDNGTIAKFSSSEAIANYVQEQIEESKYEMVSGETEFFNLTGEDSGKVADAAMLSKVIIDNEEVTSKALGDLDDRILKKQDKLVSGKNISTINGESLLSGEDIWISTDSPFVTGDYYNSAKLKYSYGTITRGNHSVAEGDYTKTLGNYSHAEGYNTTASGLTSHAEGQETTASGEYSHAEGYKTTASDYHSHAEGSNTTASGNASHAEGSGAKALGYRSHAEGSYTTASGSTSHAEGENTKALGNYSHAEGYYTEALGNYSHAEGIGTKASGSTSHAEGSYTKALGNYSHAEGYYTEALKDYSHAEGYKSIASGSSSHAESESTKALGNYSHAEGSNTIASGSSSHAEGNNTTASGNYSHAEGYIATASGSSSHAEGAYTEASGNYSHAEGIGTKASGRTSHAEGENAKALGSYSHAEGYETTTNNDFEHAEGKHNISNKNTGEYGNSGNTQHSIGIGSGPNNRKNAFEVMQNGDIYAYNLGGYDGTNATGNSKTLQTVIKEAVSGSGATYTAGEHINITDNVISVTGITVPTKTSELTNDSGFLTGHQSIKTVNGNALTGTGNVSVGTVTSVGITAGSGIAVTGSPVTGNGSITVAIAPTIAGSTTRTSVASIPVTHRAVLATISATGALSFASLPADGYEVHVIIRNSGSGNISVTLPKSNGYICTSEDTIYIAAGQYGEVNVINIGGTGYVHGINSI